MSAMLARTLVAAILSFACVVAAPLIASAQPDELQRARALFEETAFEDALAVLDGVREDARFTRDDVISWLVLRARLASAQGDDAALGLELLRLARLTDDVALPPDLLARFEALARSTPELAVSLRWENGVLEAMTIEDPQLVREVRVMAREREAQSGSAEDDGGARIGVGQLAIAEPTECRAEVIGPGGAVLASAAGCPASARAVTPDVHDPTPREGGDDGVWIAIGVTAGVLALAGGAIAIGMVLGTQPTDVQVGSVVVRW